MSAVKSAPNITVNSGLSKMPVSALNSTVEPLATVAFVAVRVPEERYVPAVSGLPVTARSGAQPLTRIAIGTLRGLLSAPGHVTFTNDMVVFGTTGREARFS